MRRDEVNPRASGMLRTLLASGRPEHILEAHNALSAQIAEEAGFEGVWVSSLTMSCSLGVRDNNEVSVSQALDLLEGITDRVSIPVLFDGDTGYGSFNHFGRLVSRLCARSVAGVCIEDKTFPKTNSLLRSAPQRLTTIDDFCGKIQAGLDARTDRDFTIVARTEALIAGLGLGHTLERAARYAEAGADAILVHSRSESFEQIEAFMARWQSPVPIVCVPTIYSRTPKAAFAEAGVSLVIWANHLLRAAVLAMQRVAGLLREAPSGASVEAEISPLAELFRLQDAHGIARLQELYGTSPAHRDVSPGSESPKVPLEAMSFESTRGS
ncbi:MAG: phosphoenolpyruvate mutase [Acidobacteriota bacterium]